MLGSVGAQRGRKASSEAKPTEPFRRAPSNLVGIIVPLGSVPGETSPRGLPDLGSVLVLGTARRDTLRLLVAALTACRRRSLRGRFDPAGSGSPCRDVTLSFPRQASISLPRVHLRTPRPRLRSSEIVGGAWHADPVLPPRCLHDDDAGCWCITTQTSAHLINLDLRTVTRIEGAGEPTAGAGFTVSALRRDGEALPLLELRRCEIGRPMELLIRIRDDCVTGRRTTSVVSITPAKERSPRA